MLNFIVSNFWGAVQIRLPVHETGYRDANNALAGLFREIYHPKCPGDTNGRFVCDDFYRRLLLHRVHQRLLLGEICED